MSAKSASPTVIDLAGFERLLKVLAADGYELVAPTVADSAIVYDRISGGGELPIGWTDEQEGGRYRLHKRDDEARFGYVVGPQSWKKYLFPPEEKLWSARRTSGGGMEVDAAHEAPPKRALIGVRACELHAIAIQDRVFMGGDFTDDLYRARRESLFIVAVNCTQAAATCFCVSMNTGPKAESGFDLSLTEVLEGEDHYFTLESGSERGHAILGKLGGEAAGDAQLRAAEAARAPASNQQRAMLTEGLPALLMSNYEHKRWDDVAERCLSCANCTMVCPTCFCSTVEDVTDLTGDHAERWRKWDSCFTGDFTYIHGGSVRTSIRSRYRQWMTHKLATWHEQFGSSGCVGCGRCITWCPVGIDLTEEVRAISMDAGEES
ncbi:MAG: 4Fe-4S dicluster domain-containing protein [Chrysiogenetes bacterium]|nr:4Fe-4S dicluster domain-containing protein [Chrysiogenetes bacterium]